MAEKFLNSPLQPLHGLERNLTSKFDLYLIFTHYSYVFLLFQMKAKVSKFDKFIKDNEAKRRRAIQKYQTEVLLKEQKQSEYEMLCDQFAELKRR